MASRFLRITLALVFSAIGTHLLADELLDRIVEHAISDGSGELPNTLDLSRFRDSTRHLPIGVFDSGVGGLTVLEAILNADAFHNETLAPGGDGVPDFEKERFLYLGDQANMPYGNYNSVGKGDYLRELVAKDAIFLLGKRDRQSAMQHATFNKLPVKAIVIACNTATAVGLADLREAIRTWRIPVEVIGVVEAGAESVRDRSPADPSDRSVAVLATVGTCSLNAYPNTIGRVLGLAGRRIPKIVQQGSIGLAGAIEGDPAYLWKGRSEDRPQPYRGPVIKPDELTEGSGLSGLDRRSLIVTSTEHHLNSIESYVYYDVLQLVDRHRSSGETHPIRTVVLGCTHFPLVADEIRSSFHRIRELTLPDGSKPYQSLIDRELEFVNPAEDTAKALFRSLAKSGLRIPKNEESRLDHDRFYISVPNPNFPGIKLSADGKDLAYEYKYGRETGRLNEEDTFPVALTPDLLPGSTKSLLQSRLPAVWSRLTRSQAASKSLSRIEGYSWTFPVMGTTMSLQAYTDRPQHLEEVFHRVQQQVDRHVGMLSDYDDESEVMRLARDDQVGAWQGVSGELWEVLQASDRWNRLTEGAFDPAIGSLTKLWRIARKKKSPPSDEDIRVHLERSGWRFLDFDQAQHRVRNRSVGLRLDFGAIAKGWIVEQAFQLLKREGYPQSLVRSGGDMRCGDPPPDRKAWRIEIGKIDPSEPLSEIVEVSNRAIASSGDLFQYLEVDGKRISHVLNPATGQGIPGPLMATVLADTATDADACATSMCILGHEKGIALAERISKVEVRIVSLSASAKKSSRGIETPRISKTKGFPSNAKASGQ